MHDVIRKKDIEYTIKLLEFNKN